jgi:hypothetical protein
MIMFCDWTMKNAHYWLIGTQLLFMTNEAYIHFSGYVNFQHTNLESRKALLCSQDSATWQEDWNAVCCARHITGPIFYHEPLNWDQCVTKILEPILNNRYNKQDNATVDIALEEVFNNMVFLGFKITES